MNDNTILSCEGLNKSFAGVPALENVSFDVRRGEVHALCGENGAGKSTLIKIISGAQAPDSGAVSFNGRTYTAYTPWAVAALGISAVYQEFSLVPYLSVYENVFLGKELMRGPVRDRRRMREETRRLCREMGVDIDVNARICDLSVAYQQLVEIVKAVSKRAELVIMDEPTAVLTVKETEIFFRLIRKLKEGGVTVLFISHRMEEVFEVCDRVTVLCDGKKIITEETSKLTKKALISYMVGREIRETYPRPEAVFGEPLIKCDGMRSAKLKGVSFEVRRGEIVGFGGLVGSGRTELARALFGADKLDSGEIYYKGKKFAPKSPSFALRHGIGLLPESRKEQGLMLGLDVCYNQTISVLDKCMRSFLVSKKKLDGLSDRYIRELSIKAHSKRQRVMTLSGGNQQKVVLSKILARDCDLVIFDEPTRGIDVNAKQEIYSIMSDMAAQGKAIIMISSDMPELMGMSNRIYVMSGGCCVAELAPDEFSQERILELASSKL